MSRKRTLWIILDLIFLIVFNVIFFVVGGTQHPASVWVAYTFIHVAYFAVIVTPLLIRKSSSSAVFGFSLYTVSSFYFITEFVVGLVFILTKPESGRVSFVVQILLLGMYAVVLLSNLLSSEHTADSIERHEQEVNYIKQASARIKLMLDKLDDPKVNREIESVYDALHASPVRSVAAASRTESEIVRRIASLELAIRAKDTESSVTLCAELREQINERNTIIKTNQ